MFAKCNTCYPPVEIKENKDSYRILMELPGSHRDDIKIWQENGLLTITGEKKAPAGEKVLEERLFGEFSRVFALPENADTEKIEANYGDGIVTVDIPKLEKAKPRDIKIN